MRWPILALLVLALLSASAHALLTSRRVKQKAHADANLRTSFPNTSTTCNVLNLATPYNYSGIAASGYLKVGKRNSVLAFTFYGQKDVRDKQQLKNYPTVLWLNGGPGSSSQLGNLQEIGPLQLVRDFDVVMKQNNFTWANKYNLLFIDQPVGTGLSYADTENGYDPFVKSMDGMSLDT